MAARRSFVAALNAALRSSDQGIPDSFAPSGTSTLSVLTLTVPDCLSWYPARVADEPEATLARLAELAIGLQRQIVHLETVFTEQFAEIRAEIRESERRTADLTDAKFVTYRTLIDSQAEKVALALKATETAIGKAETATEKAILKAEAANDKRFESVNEFRSQLADQAATFTTRREAAVHAESVNERITRLDDQVKTAQIWQGNLTGRIAVAGVALTVLMTVIVFAANFVTRGS